MNKNDSTNCKDAEGNSIDNPYPSFGSLDNSTVETVNPRSSIEINKNYYESSNYDNNHNPIIDTNNITHNPKDQVEVLQKIDISHHKIKKRNIKIEAKLMEAEEVFDYKESYFKTEENKYSNKNI